ncbi:MAG: LL-diaminopimelate aminotransferase [Erythrobacteraceae bacterium]|nr:LL-diaminopimelate aminotransferase [Erythrobacteraceae bacterium]
MVDISKRLKSLPAYLFAEIDKKVDELKESGAKVIDFGVGDPKEPTVGLIRNYTKRSIDKRKDSGYPSYIGDKDFRDEVVSYFKKRFSVDLNPETEVCSTLGSKEAVFNFPEAFINPGDYVLIPNPGYPPWEKGTLFAEGKCFFMNLTEENNFFPELDKVPEDIRKKAKILWLNYPNNPTTQVATKEFYEKAVAFAKENDLLICSDEAYVDNYFGEDKPISLLEVAKENVIVFHSLSKRSAMTCYRVGFVAGDKKIVDAFKKLKTNIDTGTATFIQDAAVAALSDENHVEEFNKIYQSKMKIISDALKSIGLPDSTPQGTIYLWQKLKDGMDSVEFATKLLDKKIALVVTPGEALSNEVDGVNPGKNYVRFALVPTINECKEAAKRISDLKI